MKLICTFFFLALVYSGSSFAQYFSVDTIRDESPYNSQFSFIFPHVTSKSHPEPANLIFKDMAKDILDIEPGEQKRSLFENIWGSQDMDLARVSEISYKVINNDENFFCISISATGCGAYCEDWTRYYTYESGSGRKIKLEDIFTPDGLQNILGLVHTLQTKRIQDNIADINEGLRTKVLSDDDKREYKKAINMFDQCLHQSGSGGFLSYSLDKTQIIIYQDYCLPHAIHYLDKMDYSFIFDIAAIRNYLSDYGKSLLKQ